MLWDVPTELEIGVIPKRLYCNKDLIKPLEQAFKNLISTSMVKGLKTFDTQRSVCQMLYRCRL
jgi:hypothetical protein